MVNTATAQIIQPTMVTVEQVKGLGAQGIVEAEDRRHVLTAHRMIEQYLGKPRPMSKVTATYTPTDLLEPLAAVAEYPINIVTSVLDAASNTITGISNDDRYVWRETGWPSTVIVQYVGGLEQQVFDALIRQTSVLADRQDVSPESANLDIGGDLAWNWDAKYRSGLSPDVKQMLFPLRTIGF